MHELAITQRLLELALSHAERAGARRITDLHIVIGALSSVVDDSVSFYWDLISEGTPAEGSRLHFRRVPLELACQKCHENYRPGEAELHCPRCGSAEVRVVAGDEFSLESIDVDPTERAVAGSPGRAR